MTPSEKIREAALKYGFDAWTSIQEQIAAGYRPHAASVARAAFEAGARFRGELDAEIADAEASAYERLRQDSVFSDSFEERVDMCKEIAQAIRGADE